MNSIRNLILHYAECPEFLERFRQRLKNHSFFTTDPNPEDPVIEKIAQSLTRDDLLEISESIRESRCTNCKSKKHLGECSNCSNVPSECLNIDKSKNFGPTAPFFPCFQCFRPCEKLYSLKKHMIRQHKIRLLDETDLSDENETSSESESEIDTPIFGEGNDDDDEENNPSLQHVIDEGQKYMEMADEVHDFLTIYTREVRNQAQLLKKTQEIMAQQTSSFDIQIELGFILRKIGTGKYHIFYAAENSSMFEDAAITVRKRRQFKKVYEAIENHGWDSFFKTTKSGEVVERLLYARFLVTSDKRPLGACTCAYADLPMWLKKSHFIWSSDQANTNGRHVCDRICVFRAIGEHFFRKKNYIYGQTRAQIQKKLFNRFVDNCRDRKVAPKEFDGVLQSEFDKLENLFEVGMTVYVGEEEPSSEKN